VKRDRASSEIQADRIQADLENLAQQMLPFHLHMSEEKKRRIHLYCVQLVAWNRRYALLSRQDTKHVVRKHIGASLGVLLLGRPGQGEEWVDVGTGAGFPGLVLKLWDPSFQVVLIDGSRKKCIFLQHVAQELGLGQLPIHPVRVETLVGRGEMLGRYHLLLARAVADVATTLREFGPLVRPGGRIITFKGPQWREDLSSAGRDGILSPGRYLLEEVVQIPWAPGHLLALRKSGG
jgi:16S rRNA (guanine527-N7)-methyltransferase